MSREKRALLNQMAKIDRGTVESDQLSTDGTRKLVVKFGEKARVECMLDFVFEKPHGIQRYSFQNLCEGRFASVHK